MERCALCGNEFEPLPLPESKLFPLKPLHKLICHKCALKGVSIFLTLVGYALKEEEEEKSKL